MNPGKYVAKLLEWKLGTSSKGGEQIGLLFEITAGEFAGEKITAYKSFSESAFPWTEKALKALGWDGKDFEDFTGLGEKTAQIEVEKDTYEGKTKLKVSWINPIGVAMKNEMTSGQKRSFAERMRKLQAATQAGRTFEVDPEDDLPPELRD